MLLHRHDALENNKSLPMTSKLIRMGNLIQPTKKSRSKGKVLLDLTRKEAPFHWVPTASPRVTIVHGEYHQDTQPNQPMRPKSLPGNHERQGGKYVTQGRQYHRGPSI
jgi:hypothetical protein